jgi:23S rRNA (uracil1939-C5)-methyltransferase
MTKCSYFKICNGCSTQHIPYNLQLENKKKALSQRINFEEIEVFSGNEYNYRNRIDFIFNSNGPAMRAKKNSVVNVKRCEICDERINNLLTEIKSNFTNVDYFNFKKKIGTFCYAVVRVAKNTKSISFVLNKESHKLGEAIEKIDEFAKKSSADLVIVTFTDPQKPNSITEDYNIIKGNDFLEENLLDFIFEYNVQGFFQNNLEVAKLMHKYCNSLLSKFKDKNMHLLDLYGGVGTFGIINSQYFKDVTIVEGFDKCIVSANENIKKNNLANCKTVVLDAKKLKTLELSQPLVAIIDPPRSGMHSETIATLNKLKPESIIYVSCNIVQLGKDVKKFKEYKINKAALFDQFPQTNHVEAIVELVLE